MADKKDEGKPVDTIQYDGRVDKSYIPEGFESQEAFLADMRDTYAQDLDFDRVNREQALDDKKFSAGEQWDPVVLQQRKGLPCLVINSVPQFTAQLVGDWRESRKAVKVIASDDNDVDVADVRGDLIRAIENHSRADRVYDGTFESQVQCGDGAFRVSVEYSTDDVFDQEIYVRPIEDALSVVWDRFSVDPTGRDARHVFVDDLVSKTEFERKWPGQAPSTLNERDRRTMVSGGWIEEAGVRVTEYWRMIERPRLLSMFEDGSVRFVDDQNMDDLIDKHGPPVKTRVSPCLYAQMHLVTGFTILTGPFEYKLNRVPVVRMTGRVVNIGGRRVRYGLVRFMKDPVRLRNFWRSVAAEQLGYAPKAQWIASEAAVEGREDQFRKAHLTRDPLLIYNEGAEPPERVEPPAPQAALLAESTVNTQDMKDVTGIHDASLGVKSNETSGRAINARQREGDIASLTYYDNGNAAVLEAGDIMNQLIPQIYDGTRVVRLIGEDEEQKFVRINDPMDPRSPDLSVGKYDVALSTGTSYTTRRAEAAQAMMEAIQVAPELMQIAGDIIVKAQNWPGADKLAERLKKTIPPQFLDDEEGGAMALTPEQIQEAQMEMQALQAENEQLKADKTLEALKLQIDVYNAETQRIRALSDNMVDGNQLELDAIDNILKHSISLEGQKKAAEKPSGSTSTASSK